MPTELTTLQASRQKEDLYRIHKSEVSRLKKTHNHVYKKLVEENQGVLKQTQKDYDRKLVKKVNIFANLIFSF